jgi:formyltetrahydrofolate deformylase
LSAQVLLVECADQRGLVHAITGVLVKHGVNVVGNQEFVERASARFFMRTEFDGPVEAPPRASGCPASSPSASWSSRPRNTIASATCSSATTSAN